MLKSKILLVICHLSFVILMSGCATLIEGTKGVVGISTKVLEDKRPSALKQAFNYDYNTCYAKAKDALIVMQCYIYAEAPNKNLIAIYVSKEDTTPVGIFFKAIDNSNTQIEVSSASTYAKESIAQRIFAVISGLPDPIPPVTKEEE
ncbi:MAG: DUF3568 family protein [Candidatus Omnitrophica bacterium]|nr:DUF3568 family protein [Candidatus Omnitrophota bacterium]MBI5144804.1 DUF3568 family protein [Candidatus Omnitrophota bacterium]